MGSDYEDMLTARQTKEHQKIMIYSKCLGTSSVFCRFGGIHSQYNFLSNYYPSRLTHMDITFDSVEHAYQYQKAIRYHDIDSSKNILCCSTPSEVKRIGYHIKNFRSKDWDSVKEDLMQDLL